VATKVDLVEVMGVVDFVEHQQPKTIKEALLRVQLGVLDLGITSSLTLKDWSEKSATKYEKEAEAIFNELNPEAIDDSA
jgi:hypothetical protein